MLERTSVPSAEPAEPAPQAGRRAERTASEVVRVGVREARTRVGLVGVHELLVRQLVSEMTSHECRSPSR
jgi:hypothetical protein